VAASPATPNQVLHLRVSDEGPVDGSASAPVRSLGLDADAGGMEGRRIHGGGNPHYQRPGAGRCSADDTAAGTRVGVSTSGDRTGVPAHGGSSSAGGASGAGNGGGAGGNTSGPAAQHGMAREAADVRGATAAGIGGADPRVSDGAGLHRRSGRKMLNQQVQVQPPLQQPSVTGMQLRPPHWLPREPQLQQRPRADASAQLLQPQPPLPPSPRLPQQKPPPRLQHPKLVRQPKQQDQPKQPKLKQPEQPTQEKPPHAEGTRAPKGQGRQPQRCCSVCGATQSSAWRRHQLKPGLITCKVRQVIAAPRAAAAHVTTGVGRPSRARGCR
jgi:hypothetical protein